MLSSTLELVEGNTRLLVPIRSVTDIVPPKVPAFFNPSAKRNRDISILVYSTFSEDNPKKILSFADSLSGVGARGLRVGVELNSIAEVSMNDINPMGMRFARRAAKLNSIQEKCHFHVEEACSFLISNRKEKRKRYDIVDLDPFGSPSPYLDCVLRAVRDGGVISITATDMAVLCGIYPNVCFRKYQGLPINNEFSNEIGIRLLIALIATTAARLNLSICPLFTHTNLHFMRAYLKVQVNNIEANMLRSKLGNVAHCIECGHRRVLNEAYESRYCQSCFSKCAIGGPLWKDPINDIDFLKKMAKQLTRLVAFQKSCNLRKSVVNLLNIGIEEIQIPYYFLTDTICSKIKKSPPPISDLIRILQKSGFKASRATLNSRAFKTDASLNEILSVLK